MLAAPQAIHRGPLRRIPGAVEPIAKNRRPADCPQTRGCHEAEAGDCHSSDQKRRDNDYPPSLACHHVYYGVAGQGLAIEGTIHKKATKLKNTSFPAGKPTRCRAASDLSPEPSA